MKKREFILLGAIAVIALGMWIVFRICWSGGGELLRVSVDGEIYGEYNLNEDQTISIQETNVCRIQDGAVSMVQAKCPDQLCVQHREIESGQGGTIVCLPNRVVLEIVECSDQLISSTNSAAYAVSCKAEERGVAALR